MRVYRHLRETIIATAGALAIFLGSLQAAQISFSEPPPQHLDELTVRGETYHGVAVLTKSASHVFLRHDRGIANFKVDDLDLENRRKLGYEPAPGQVKSAAQTLTDKLTSGFRTEAHARGLDGGAAQVLNQTISRWGITAMAIAGAGILSVYVLFCYCGLQICRKVGQDPGPLIWIPWLQWLPLFRAAGMSTGWFVLTLVPIANILAFLVWSRRIAKACGKSLLTGLLLMFPLTNLPALCYLAFSASAESSGGGPATKIKL